MGEWERARERRVDGERMKRQKEGVGASERVQRRKNERGKSPRRECWTSAEERRKEYRPTKDEEEYDACRTVGCGDGGEMLLTPPSIQDGVGSGSPRH